MADISTTIFDELQKEILSLKIIPGEKINEADICERFSVTRPPVRSAFQRLADIRLIDLKPYKGASATLISLEEVHQMIFLRIAVESWIIKDFIASKPSLFMLEELWHNLRLQKIHIQAEKVDEKEFFNLDSHMHQYWFDSMKCLEVWKMIQSNLNYERFRMLDFVGTLKYSEIVRDHELLLNAISNDDEEQVVPILSSHLNAGLRRMGNLLKTDYKQYFILNEKDNDYWVEYNKKLTSTLRRS